MAKSHLYTYLLNILLLINSFLFKFILNEVLYYSHKQKSGITCHKCKVTMKTNYVIL